MVCWDICSWRIHSPSIQARAEALLDPWENQLTPMDEETRANARARCAFGDLKLRHGGWRDSNRTELDEFEAIECQKSSILFDLVATQLHILSDLLLFSLMIFGEFFFRHIWSCWGPPNGVVGTGWQEQLWYLEDLVHCMENGLMFGSLTKLKELKYILPDDPLMEIP